MRRIFVYRRRIVLFLMLLDVLVSLTLTYAFWASTIHGSSDNADAMVSVGDWGTPIFTTSEFYSFATKANSTSTDRYYLANDLNFAGYNWTYVSSVIFRGQLNGNHKTISNLSITVSGGSYHGIFPRANSAQIRDLTLSNVQMISGFSSSSQVSGLLVGQVTGGTNTFHNITVINSGVQGYSANGVGGLIGYVNGSGGIVNLTNIKTNNLKVYNHTSSAGGLIGRTNNGTTINISDVDILTDVYAQNSSSNVGGLIGYVISGAYVNITRAIVQATFRNTLVNNSYYNRYAQRYLGGLIGYNASSSTNQSRVQISHVFFTGSLFTYTNNRRADVGTVSGRKASGALASLINTYHAYVAYRSSSGATIYTPDKTLTGQSGTLISSSSLPTVAWWNGFATNFYNSNNLWQQHATTGRLELKR